MPISITHHEDMVYVLNAGGDGNIVGFHFSNGQLAMIAGSDRPLSQSAPGPAQIEFVRNGSQLVVTEKGTNSILVYNVDRSTRMASQPVVNASVGTTPFGFAFDNRGRLIVSNAAGGAAGAGSLSAYVVRRNGTLEVTAAEVPNFQGAPCWVVVTNDGRYTYTTNTASNTTSGYAIHPRGQLELLDPSGVSGNNTGAPIDAAVTRHGGKYLYVLNGSGNAIDAFAIESNGDLTSVAGGITGLTAGTNGLVAY
jgi:6-phosphogluconolactonase (cycloisomerase 2 family)